MHDLAQRWASRLLERLLPEDVAEALVGDLLEEHTLRVRTAGPRRAAFWYWGQVVRSVVPVLHTAFRRGDWVLAWVVGFVAYSFASSAEMSARDSVALVATHTAVDAVPVLIIYLGTIALGAYVAERVRAGAGLALGLLVALTAVLELVTDAHDMPLWYRCALLIAGPAAALAGRTLLARWSRGAPASRRRRTVG
jgi:hypothetical protein